VTSLNVFDAHVHMGYYTRAGYDEPFYYSPRRVLGMLIRCGVGEFIVSSTNSQVQEIAFGEILREARELCRIAGKRAHQLLWVSGRIIDEDPKLDVLDLGLYEGVKLHGVETPWLTCRRDSLRRVLDEVARRGMIVQLHTGCDSSCHPYEWGKFAQIYPMIKMDFAHCRPMKATLDVMRSCPNVFTDISFVQRENVYAVLSSDVMDRVMFGSDFPAYHAQVNQSFAETYRGKTLGYLESDWTKMTQAFWRFLSNCKL